MVEDGEEGLGLDGDGDGGGGLLGGNGGGGERPREVEKGVACHGGWSVLWEEPEWKEGWDGRRGSGGRGGS